MAAGWGPIRARYRGRGGAEGGGADEGWRDEADLPELLCFRYRGGAKTLLLPPWHRQQHLLYSSTWLFLLDVIHAVLWLTLQLHHVKQEHPSEKQHVDSSHAVACPTQLAFPYNCRYYPTNHDMPHAHWLALCIQQFVRPSKWSRY